MDVISDLMFQGSSNKQLDVEEFDDRRKDHISHFILRLAYCRS